MSAEKSITLETEGDGAVAFSDLLSRIHARKLEDCKFSWDIFDQMCPGEMMDTINKFADEGLTTPEIFKWLKPHLDKHKLDKPQVLELMALATEYAVRTHAA